MVTYSTLLILMVVVWTAGKAFRAMGLPVVLGELLGGVLVGPSVFGIVGAENETILTLADLGVFFLMVHAGLKTDHRELLQSTKASLVIAAAGVALPFAGGYAVSRLLFDQSVQASLFVGVTLCFAEIALTARVFKDCGLQDTPIAHLKMAAAILDDILSLILFSLVLSLTREGGIDPWSVLLYLTKVVAFFGVVVYGGKRIAPLLHRVLYRGNKGFTLALIFSLLLGLAAEMIGLHVVIGAFLAGLFIQEETLDPKVFAKIEDRFYALSYSLFGPVFFASLALHLDFTALWTTPVAVFVLTATALVTKLVGSGGTALLIGLPRLEALLVGLAMNNRGAVALVVASVGLRSGLIGSALFSLLVLVTFLTTIISVLLTVPVARRLKAAG